jgi:carbon-monoxide dehydrogenase medium subunit
MVALDGSVTAVGPNGSRSIPVKELVSGPFQTILSRDEIATEAVIQPAQGTRVGGYLKLERRVGDFATAGVAIALEMSGDSVTKAGIGLTGVGSQTVDASDAAAALVGSRLDAESIANAARLAAEISKPRSDHRGSADYKRHVVSTFVSRILANVQRSEQQVA